MDISSPTSLWIINDTSRGIPPMVTPLREDVEKARAMGLSVHKVQDPESALFRGADAAAYHAFTRADAADALT